MLQPSRRKYRKEFRGSMGGVATRSNFLAFGDFGIKAETCGWLSALRSSPPVVPSLTTPNVWENSSFVSSLTNPSVGKPLAPVWVPVNPMFQPTSPLLNPVKFLWSFPVFPVKSPPKPFVSPVTNFPLEPNL